MSISPEVQEYIKLWKPLPREKRPSWYRWDGGWYEVDGDKTRYCEWPLDENSVVFDIGGYEGRFALMMTKKFNLRLHVFEPAPKAFGLAQEKLKGYEKVKLYPFGLGNKNGKFPLGDAHRDGASFLKSENPVVMADMVDIDDFIQSNKIDHIDLMAINIEGGEFELLPYIIHTDIVNIISHFMIQWHHVIKGAGEIMLAIQNKLAETHEMMWNHGAWEAWNMIPVST